MKTDTRRTFLRTAAASLHPFYVIAAPKSTDVRIREVRFEFQDHLYRTPMQFGGNVVDRVTLLNVHCRVENGAGKSAEGFGSMPLGNVWSFPSKVMPYDETLAAMKALAAKISKQTGNYNESGHPVEANVALEPEYLKAATEVTRELRLKEPIPKLCTLVTASPFDAAVHDAYGKLYGLSSYKTYGRDFLRHDLSRFLGVEFKGLYLDRYVQTKPRPWTYLYHTVGGVDPLVDSDIKQRVDDGLPETLPEWIDYNGITHIKIKLQGGDLQWDLERTVTIDRVTSEVQARRGVKKWVYCLDFNERCPNVEFLLSFLRQVKEKAPEGFARIEYIEQPTARDLKSDRHNVMHEAAKLRPVVIDESLTDLETLLLAREMGYSGAALKACKGQTQAMLMGAAAQKYKMFLCVQDLTCPGAALIHSAGIAAHVPGVSGMEANSRQYVPSANKEWVSRMPGVFIINDGRMNTSGLNRPGLSATA
ncbi:MAG: enolase C-terminal domain-like protein [Bryobacteraceae bacterium]